MNDTVCIFPADNGGCAFYRNVQPIEQYARLTGVNIGLTPCDKPMPNLPTWQKLTSEHNIKFVLISRVFSDQQREYWQRFKRVFPNIPIYMDWDDLLWNPHPSSAYKPDVGMLRNLDATAEIADRLICSTKPLVDALWHKYKKRARVLPNMIDVGQFRKPIRRHKTEKMRIFWGGSATHAVDLALITDTVKQTHKKYEWHFMGYVPDDLRDLVRYHDGVDMNAYLETVALIKPHVGIAPLAGIPFNRCKSNIKLLEYGALGIATIASAVYPYNLSAAIKCPIGLTSEWVQALASLEDDTVRLNNAQASQEYARSFSLADHKTTILQAYN